MDSNKQKAKLAVLRHLSGVMAGVEAKKLKGHHMPDASPAASHEVVEMQADGMSPIGEGPQLSDHFSEEGISHDGNEAPHMSMGEHHKPEFEEDDLQHLHDMYSKLA